MSGVSGEIEEEIESTDPLYKAVFDHAEDAIFLMEDGVFVRCNWKALSIFGCNNKDDIIGKTPFDFSPDLQPDGVSSKEKGKFFIKKALEGEPQRFEWLHHKLDGEPFFTEVSLNRVDIPGGPPKLLAIVRDISQRKSLERQLSHAQRMEAMGVLAGGIAHDFNNMLAAILGNISLISIEARRRGSFEEIVRYAENAEKIVNQAAQITKRLLTFTSRSSLTMKVIDPIPVVKETVDILRRTIDRRIYIDFQRDEEKIWKVRADITELQHIFMNLCINAADTLMDRIENECYHSASLKEDPPAITIRVKNVEIKDEYVRRFPFARIGRFVAFSVSDNGCGMDETTLKRVFDPFFTTKGIGKGTGLGLAMVYGLVKQHKGWIIAESKPGVGSTFTFYISSERDGGEVREHRKDNEKEARAHVAKGDKSLFIMLAEDEVVVRDVCSTMLEHLGHRVVVARDGEEAVELYKKHAPDLVFLDLTMPKLSGEEALKLILEHDPEAKVVISSGHPKDAYCQKLLEMGARLYLQKPYRIKEVKETIEKVMEE